MNITDRDPHRSIELKDSDPEPNQALDLWFHDSEEIAHGCRICIKINSVLCHYRSRFQEIAVFETEKLGRMLVLDGITMLTEFDEPAYHEMICHVPLCVHPNPANILVIGGGDGGTVRELLKHNSVDTIHLCEIDEEVIKTSRRYLPSVASGLDDPRVDIFYEDGARFVREHPKAYDVIIVDSTDPIGPGRALFQREFYEDMRAALTPDGIAVSQCESIYFHPHVIRGVASFVRDLFPKWGYYYTLVPTYPSGTIGFMFCSLSYHPVDDMVVKKAGSLRDVTYYSPEVHRSSFVLPGFARELLGVHLLEP